MFEVVLLKDVASIGRAGEKRIVKPGFFFNFLKPRGLAALSDNPKASDFLKKNRALEVATDSKQQAAEEKRAVLEGKVLSFERKATSTGKAYRSIRSEEIAERLDLKAETIELEKPIKDFGEHEISLNLGFGLKARMVIRLAKKQD